MIERLNEVERRLNALMQALQSNEGRLAAVEQSNWQRAGMGFPFPMGEPLSIIQIAKSTSSITARSSATYGTGSAKIQSDSGTALVDDGDTVTVKNMTDKTIASGAYVLIVKAIDLWWVAAVGSCDNLS
jgi:hypothetical protein